MPEDGSRFNRLAVQWEREHWAPLGEGWLKARLGGGTSLALPLSQASGPGSWDGEGEGVGETQTAEGRAYFPGGKAEGQDQKGPL